PRKSANRPVSMAFGDCQKFSMLGEKFLTNWCEQPSASGLFASRQPDGSTLRRRPEHQKCKEQHIGENDQRANDCDGVSSGGDRDKWTLPRWSARLCQKSMFPPAQVLPGLRLATDVICSRCRSGTGIPNREDSGEHVPGKLSGHAWRPLRFP